MDFDKMKTKNTSIREFKESDVDYVANNMRKADADELRALLGVEPKEGLIYSIEHSEEVWTGLADGMPACIFGITDCTDENDDYTSALIWTLGTEQFFKYTKQTCLLTSRVFDSWLEKYDLLFNYIWEGNKKHQNWLKRMGFIIFEDEYVEGVDGDKFYFFANFSYPEEE